jgi:hypothetical protein
MLQEKMMMSFEHCLQPIRTLPGIGVKRQKPRHDFHAEVEVLPMDVRYSRIFGYAEDISNEGMFIRTCQRVEMDTLLVLKVHSDHGMLRLVARVVHLLEGTGFGCEFVEVDHRQQATLSHLVSLRAAAPPDARNIH